MKTKINSSVLVALLLSISTSYGQAIFAHNDYLKPKPLWNAMELKAEYIEADIFLEQGVLLVAHTKKEIDPSMTLEKMYLEPLSNRKTHEFNLMIDLKTGGAETMTALIKLLEKTGVATHDSVHVVLSGNYPPPSEWKNYPSYIWFDGRPNVDYTSEQVKRLRLVSTSFSSVSNWKGEGEIPKADLDKIVKTIAVAHKLNMPMRFWGSPDTENAWRKFIEAGVDVINSDNIDPLSEFILKLRAESQRSR